MESVTQVNDLQNELKLIEIKLIEIKAALNKISPASAPEIENTQEKHGRRRFRHHKRYIKLTPELHAEYSACADVMGMTIPVLLHQLMAAGKEWQRQHIEQRQQEAETR